MGWLFWEHVTDESTQIWADVFENTTQTTTTTQITQPSYLPPNHYVFSFCWWFCSFWCSFSCCCCCCCCYLLLLFWSWCSQRINPVLGWRVRWRVLKNQPKFGLNTLGFSCVLTQIWVYIKWGRVTQTIWRVLIFFGGFWYFAGFWYLGGFW